MMKRPNFFCDSKSFNCLLGMKFDGEYKDIDLTMDFIEIPFMFIFTSNKKSWTVKAMMREEMYTHDDSGIEDSRAVICKPDGEVQISAKANSALKEKVGIFCLACRNISYFIQEKGIEELYADLDPEKAGILLSMDGDTLTYKVVSGKDRPDLTCVTLDGDIEWCRPYSDEVLEQFNFDMMSFEEKLEAAENGDERAMEAVAEAYLNGDEENEIDEDPEKAFYWFAKLAELDNAVAQFNLGLYCAKGYGTKRDFEKAAYWMKKAAENGDEDASAIAEKYTEAANKMKKAESGDAQAQADLASLLTAQAGSLEQAGVDGDYKLAFELATKSAAQNNCDGICALAFAYEHGLGVEKDIPKVIELYKRGADLGHAPSQYGLAYYYMSGEHLEKNKKTAFELLEKAAEQGYKMAQFRMAKIYEQGEGTKADLDKAIEWGEKAATGGNAEIQYEVAKLYTYAKDDGKMINAERARYWYAQAAEQGHEMAKTILSFAPMWEEG